MLLDAAAGGTMMTVSPEEATQIIESLASSDHQAKHGRHQSHKRGVLDLSTNDAILAQNKLLSQQIEALTKQMAKVPQQLHAIASSSTQSNSSLKCDFCGGDHPNGHCSDYPSMHERTSKLEDTLNQFMQVFMNNQTNTEASIKNSEVQVVQLADMSGGPFSANTKTNPKEHCKAIITRSGKVVGEDVGVSENNKGVDNKEENSELKEVEEESEKNKGENNKSENVDSEKIREKSGVEKEKNRKKGKEVNSTIPVKNLPYPHAPSKKEKERQFLRFLDIIKKLQINIPFTEAMEKMPTYARFMKELLTKKRRILEEETVELEAGCSAIIQKSLP
ncbi:uncharacterized protein LOC109817457 [Cajanus cajan]|nr:uncharacterized protein LOC109817457 [Cajanus cajan]